MTTSADDSEAAACLHGLARCLPPLATLHTARGPDTRACSVALTAEVSRVIRIGGGHVRHGVPLDLFRVGAAGAERQCFLGIHGTFSDGSTIAVEVGRANSSRARYALEYAAQELGAASLWVRWRGKVKAEPGEGVQVLDITRLGHKVRRMHRASPLR